MNGLEVGRKLRQFCPDTRIIFVTLNSDDAVMNAALQIAVGYFQKGDALKGLVPTVLACCSPAENGARE